MKAITGFSKLTKDEKIKWLASELSGEAADLVSSLPSYWHPDLTTQKKFDEFSENTLTNFDFPFGLAPNFLINNHIYSVPMVIEESSVVAAASLGAKFWMNRGGFKARVLSMTKVGHVHFLWTGGKEELNTFFNSSKNELLNSVKHLSANMEKRGGGILSFDLIDLTEKLDSYFQLKLTFNTCDAMGANFINSVLEQVASDFKVRVIQNLCKNEETHDFQIVMSILSNYTPECLVECSVSCPIADLGNFSDGMGPAEFAQKFISAVRIAQVDTNRAVTHNKGIMNGIDAVVLATGNDFRAVEACAHAYAARNGHYQSLSEAKIIGDQFHFSLTIPLAIGTVGGLTSLHPLAKTSLMILEQPSAEKLMMIMASVGLAQNFSAVKSLITTGIQKGHMKLHLLNVLNQLGATQSQIEEAKVHFLDKVVSFSAVRDFLKQKHILH
jgi:hydroxymethylglutaryl-CoA reductase